jgi:dienelactone hydrolase
MIRPRRPAETLAARWARLEPTLEIVRPAGDEPFPAVLMFHGCGGRRPYLADYMAAIADAGVMAISVDSFAPRGISRNRALATVCTGLELPGWKRAGDVLASLWGVRGLEGVDSERVALAGWSHGGWSIMDLMTMALRKPGEAGIADPDPALLEAVKAVVLAYPYCGPGALTQLRAWRRTPDVFALVGEADRVAHPEFCRRAFRSIERSGGRVETWFPAGATHAFDEEGSGFSFFRYDEDLKAEAVARIAAYLNRALVPPA